MNFLRWISEIFKRPVNKIKDINFFPNLYFTKQGRVIGKLRAKHLKLTRDSTNRVLANLPVTEAEQSRLKLVDELIVHNVAILYRRFWILILILGAFIIALSVLRSRETPVYVDVKATNVMWQISNPDAGTTLDRHDWHMLANEKDSFTDDVLLEPDKNPDKIEKKLELFSCATSQPLEIYKLPLPDRCYMGIGFTDSISATINYLWRDPLAPPPVINWDIKISDRKIKYGGSMLSDTCLNERIFNLQKKLRLGSLYNIRLTRVNKWRLRRPIRVSELSFEANPDMPQSGPSIVSGKVSLINIKDKDSLNVLNEGDRLSLKFKDPVEVYLSADQGYVRLRTNGVVTSLECGPEALGENMNKMPRMLKSITDESPYLLTVVSIIVPLLIAMLVRQKKSI
ncbi:hypothetical protein LX99_02995 [Mucilaginibacter oryzae]|uniref:Uncharacterized protein n=1 Tax=Mucilaginibacter oryzae TaxID=468058 RepID=A0A316HG20_9SPHI|nr:hypothetical protein [Mucilaginibacter oryzae]PWK77185.1 hypothetical protein LX99_02995 [Mucilaginibacter oryzae]